ncbi:Hsp20/alpha crystallin family protein [Bordetella genomosp. 9]|uniref:Heat-shock protein n=1 Tax=Bordetella genomosp. 9 TaxID=1416803 RepID=A0A1W6Z300_9BORD|nr:Hsp20/alpha crystallin family protein [Bordetella genomosp. 9]ARP87755.1 heat-shock protein [Bordetella genomosp. 9]ARP91719.1 heat-shock protein [Bordetella genomosp. 9]
MNSTLTNSAAPAVSPRVDVFEDENGLTLLADMPGVPRDKLTIDVDGDTLRIEGELGESEPAQPLHTEMPAARYRRAFTLSRELDSSRIQAESRDGVLKLRIPKREQAQPRRIEIVTA